MLELTPDFIKDFAAYLSTERGLASGTIWQRCMWLKGVVMRAHYNGKIPRNPFAQFHISPNCKEREFLTEEELKQVMTHDFEDADLAFVRDIFVFICWTALAFVDVKNLTTDDIVDIIYTLYRPASPFCLNASRRSVGVCLCSRRMTTQKFVCEPRPERRATSASGRSV